MPEYIDSTGRASESGGHSQQRQATIQPTGSNEPKALPAYDSFTFRDEEGCQVSASVQLSKPEKFDGIDI